MYLWAHHDLNLGPTGYEPVALTTELWALSLGILSRGRQARPVLYDLGVSFQFPGSARVLQLL